MAHRRGRWRGEADASMAMLSPPPDDRRPWTAASSPPARPRTGDADDTTRPECLDHWARPASRLDAGPLADAADGAPSEPTPPPASSWHTSIPTATSPICPDSRPPGTLLSDPMPHQAIAMTSVCPSRTKATLVDSTPCQATRARRLRVKSEQSVRRLPSAIVGSTIAARPALPQASTLSPAFLDVQVAMQALKSRPTPGQAVLDSKREGRNKKLAVWGSEAEGAQTDMILGPPEVLEVASSATPGLSTPITPHSRLSTPGHVCVSGLSSRMQTIGDHSQRELQYFSVPPSSDSLHAVDDVDLELQISRDGVKLGHQLVHNINSVTESKRPATARCNLIANRTPLSLAIVPLYDASPKLHEPCADVRQYKKNHEVTALEADGRQRNTTADAAGGVVSPAWNFLQQHETKLDPKASQTRLACAKKPNQFPARVVSYVPKHVSGMLRHDTSTSFLASVDSLMDDGTASSPQPLGFEDENHESRPSDVSGSGSSETCTVAEDVTLALYGRTTALKTKANTPQTPGSGFRGWKLHRKGIGKEPNQYPMRGQLHACGCNGDLVDWRWPRDSERARISVKRPSGGDFDPARTLFDVQITALMRRQSLRNSFDACNRSSGEGERVLLNGCAPKAKQKTETDLCIDATHDMEQIGWRSHEGAVSGDVVSKTIISDLRQTLEGMQKWDACSERLQRLQDEHGRCSALHPPISNHNFQPQPSHHNPRPHMWNETLLPEFIRPPTANVPVIRFKHTQDSISRPQTSNASSQTIEPQCEHDSTQRQAHLRRGAHTARLASSPPNSKASSRTTSRRGAQTARLAYRPRMNAVSSRHGDLQAWTTDVID